MGMTGGIQVRTVLFTGGRAPVTLELARQFAQNGHRVLVADSLPHTLCTDSRAVSKNFVVPAPRHDPTEFIKALRQIIQRERVECLIPTCEEIFYIAAGLDDLRVYCQVLVEPLHKLKPLHNKWLFMQKMQALDLAVPQTWRVASQQALKSVLAGEVPERLVLKPVYSRFATQVRFLDTSTPILPDIDVSPAKPWVVQEFIQGRHYSLYGVAHGGRLTAFAAYPTLFTAGKGACIYFESVNCPYLLAWMQTVVAAEQFTGQIAFDMVEAENGVLYPLECNPRAISAVHLFDASARLDQAFLDTTNPLIQPKQDKCAAIRLAMVLYGLPEALMTGQFANWAKAMMTARSVIFQHGDPLPGLFLPRMLWQFARMSLQQRRSLQTVSTQDIEWDGMPIEWTLQPEFIVGSQHQ
ncbi:MAG: ATP-grasp domain-containing protein [Cyanobacteria bacterium P01_D01_bin.14]